MVFLYFFLILDLCVFKWFRKWFGFWRNFCFVFVLNGYFFWFSFRILLVLRWVFFNFLKIFFWFVFFLEFKYSIVMLCLICKLWIKFVIWIFNLRFFFRLFVVLMFFFVCRIFLRMKIRSLSIVIIVMLMIFSDCIWWLVGVLMLNC